MERGFGLAPKLVSLLSVGASVCGVSAIIATQGAIEADEEDSSIAIAAILALGAISLFVFPMVGHALHLSDRAYGVWTGLAVDNTAETAAAGALYSDAAGKIAVLTKTCRNALIGFVVLGYALYWASKGQAAGIGNKAAFLWNRFPKFVLGFLLISLLATFGFFSKARPRSRLAISAAGPSCSPSPASACAPASATSASRACAPSSSEPSAKSSSPCSRSASSGAPTKPSTCKVRARSLKAGCG